MTTMYVCPECHEVHDEPATAAYELHVRCLACALLDDRRNALRLRFSARERLASPPREASSKAA